MSASEKLKALGVWKDEGGDSGPYDVNERNREYELMAALPKIVAVVEAAEKCRYAVEPITTVGPLGIALDALDEALS